MSRLARRPAQRQYLEARFPKQHAQFGLGGVGEEAPSIRRAPVGAGPFTFAFFHTNEDVPAFEQATVAVERGQPGIALLIRGSFVTPIVPPGITIPC
jgi:hypothetical protein